MAVFINDNGIFVDNKKVISVPLTNNYDFKAFDCGDEDLNDFLLHDSKINLKHLRFTTTLLETNSEIVAYYSLANDLLSITDKEDFKEEIDNDSNTNIENSYYEQFLNETAYPAVKIGRLAVNKKFQSGSVK